MRFPFHTFSPPSTQIAKLQLQDTRTMRPAGCTHLVHIDTVDARCGCLGDLSESQNLQALSRQDSGLSQCYTYRRAGPDTEAHQVSSHPLYVLVQELTFAEETPAGDVRVTVAWSCSPEHEARTPYRSVFNKTTAWNDILKIDEGEADPENASLRVGIWAKTAQDTKESLFAELAIALDGLHDGFSDDRLLIGKAKLRVGVSKKRSDVQLLHMGLLPSSKRVYLESRSCAINHMRSFTKEHQISFRGLDLLNKAAADDTPDIKDAFMTLGSSRPEGSCAASLTKDPSMSSCTCDPVSCPLPSSSTRKTEDDTHKIMQAVNSLPLSVLRSRARMLVDCWAPFNLAKIDESASLLLPNTELEVGRSVATLGRLKKEFQSSRSNQDPTNLLLACSSVSQIVTSSSIRRRVFLVIQDDILIVVQQACDHMSRHFRSPMEVLLFRPDAHDLATILPMLDKEWARSVLFENSLEKGQLQPNCDDSSTSNTPDVQIHFDPIDCNKRNESSLLQSQSRYEELTMGAPDMAIEMEESACMIF
jgi:hypothetical protein